jgi:hypothetical protein
MGLVAASYDFFWKIYIFGVHTNLGPCWKLQYKLLYCLFQPLKILIVSLGFEWALLQLHMSCLGEVAFFGCLPIQATIGTCSTSSCTANFCPSNYWSSIWALIKFICSLICSFWENLHFCLFLPKCNYKFLCMYSVLNTICIDFVLSII